VRLVLTGGSEALLLGGSRPTGDIDFGLVVAPRYASSWREIETAIAAAAEEAGVRVQYSSDLDRWSPISIPPARRKTRPFAKIGRLSVHLLDPACWAVYKLARYLDSDVEDLRAVLRAEKVDARVLARLCGLSVRSSPRSTSLALFRRQVEHFFRRHGAAIWGERLDSARAIEAFHKAAGIASDL